MSPISRGPAPAPAARGRAPPPILRGPPPARAPAPPPILREPPPAQAPSSNPETHTEKPEERLHGFLRDIRVDAQYFQASLIETRKTKISDGKQEVNRLIDHNDGIFGRAQTRIMERLTSINRLMNENSELYDTDGDGVSHIGFLWYQISTGWSLLKKKDEQLNEYEIFGRIDELTQLLSELIYHSDLITIPNRVNQHLRTVRPGSPLDFREAFKDEMPKDESGVLQCSLKILQYIHAHPGSVWGVVDTENGLIFKVDPSRWRRLCSYIVIVAALVGGTYGICKGVPFLGSYLELENWSEFSDKDLLTACLFVIFGGIAHIGIDALKQIRTSGEHTFKVLEDLISWIHIKEGPILVGIFTLFLGVLIFVSLFEKIDWKAAFFVGYSIDSVIDLYFQRFTTSSSKYTDALLKSVKSPISIETT
ncbi:MAG: hypothetical protein HXS41_10210 [Theionarchaea archaeon]|nr:hypothetical protein [Theionarchaea archaeon]